MCMNQYLYPNFFLMFKIHSNLKDVASSKLEGCSVIISCSVQHTLDRSVSNLNAAHRLP